MKFKIENYLEGPIETQEKSHWKMWIYCGACKLYIIKRCEGCIREDAECLFHKYTENIDASSCAECNRFPCERHYSSKAVYAKPYLDWKKQESTK
jgi:hypothetical protein